MKRVYLRSLIVAVTLVAMLYAGCKKEDVSVKKSIGLDKLIAEATAVASGAQEGADPGLYPVGAVGQLNLAIDSAKKLSTSSVTQFGVDIAGIYLQKAITQFKGSIQQEKQLYFDGVGYLNGGAATAYNTPIFSLQAWVYPTEWKNAMYVISTEGASTGYKLQLPNGKATFVVGNGTKTFQVVAPDAVALNVWTHLAATFDGTKMKLFVNGILVGQTDLVYQLKDNGENFRIGEGSKNTGRTFKGRIRGVGVWSIAIPEAEIPALMARKLTGAETGLTAYWPFNLSAGNKIFDRSGKHFVDLINMTYVDPI